MYYSNGNYEAFAKPEKPENADKKSAYLVGAGLASLSAACFLVRDGQLKGENIHILEEMDIAGGACDGINDADRGFIIRGGREMENHFECLWDLFRSIPSLETEGASVLDEYYWLNKHDPNYSLMRATVDCGMDAHTDGKFGLTDKAVIDLLKLFMMRDEDLYGKKITDVLGRDFFESNFWLYWRTMFAFEDWHAALEMKKYMQRFIHHIGGLPDFSALKFTKYNQYESLILPLVKYLEKAGVDFQYGTMVTNVVFDINNEKKIAKELIFERGGKKDSIHLTEDDLVFVTNASGTEDATLGDHDHVPEINRSEGGCWKLWKNIAKQHKVFGNPDAFCGHIEETNWESATITTLDNKIPPYIEKICRRDPFSGKVVTGGIVTVKDSGWLMSYTLNRQPHFKSQPKDQLVVWVYGLYTDRPGDFIKKPMRDCTGYEITQEWLYHIGVPVSDIPEIARNSAKCIPCMMPYVTAFFMPRKPGDRPAIVPEGCVNFAFLGQFADTERDTVFTTEYSVRTGMEAVYTLLNIDRGVPEVFNSCFDMRVLIESTVKMMDGRKLTDLKLPFPMGIFVKPALKMLDKTMIGELLKKYHAV
ncbi:oleate hydratase [Lachnospiraceae bacterium NSJ-143]|nr:oleate hydratase [Lachnospiraceae bacterium NSJ-143]